MIPGIAISEVIDLFSALAKLGATPAVQQLLTEWLAAKLGVSQPVLEAAILAAKDAPAPKEN